MIARVLVVACALIAVPATASSPAAWSAHDREVKAKCLKASGLTRATVSGPVGFSDTIGVDVLRVRGRLAGKWAKGKSATMLCVVTRLGGKVEAQEAPAGW